MSKTGQVCVLPIINNSWHLIGAILEPSGVHLELLMEPLRSLLVPSWVPVGSVISSKTLVVYSTCRVKVR